MIDKIWKDPVCSKVIAVAILSALAWIYREIPEEYRNSAINLAVRTYELPLWMGMVVFLIILLIIFFYLFERKKVIITSQEWFEVITEKLSDCSYARLYLRSFDHPDEFREEHRESLMRIISLIAEKIRSGSDIKIVSYAPASKSKTGYNWVQSELGEDFKVDNYITIIQNQPVSNSTSMYLFDDKSVVYNNKTNGKNTYHIENYSNSIIHALIAKGLENIEGVKA